MIHSSQVKLALPSDSSIFSRSEERTKASVWLTLAPGVRLTPEQVRGLQVHIAHSIQNLYPDDVSILDHNSTLLSRRADGDAQLAEMRQRVEEEKRGKILDLLEKKVGPGNALVSVTAVLDTVSRKETRTIYDTSNPAERIRKTREEEEESPTGGSGGVPGTESNTGEATAGASWAGGTSRSVTSEESETDYPTTMTETEYRPGEVVRQSVAVVLDLRRSTDENEEVNYVSWGEENLRLWEGLIKDAVGFNSSRGDSVTIEEDSFEHSHRVEQELRETQVIEQTRRMYDIFDWGDWTSFIKIPALLLLIFFIFWFVVRPISRRVLSPIMQMPGAMAGPMIPDELPKTVEELEAEMEERLDEELELAGQVKKGTILKKRVTELALNEPESFTQLIRTWLYE
jgi:flagellar M-ring protein FliF